MMVFELITAEFRNRVKLVILCLWKSLAGSHTSAQEFIVRIVHLIAAEDGFQAAFVEGFVMRHQWQTFDEWFYLFPHFGEDWSIFCVLTSQTMYLTAPIIIIVGLRLDQRIERIHDLTIPDNHNTNGADAGPLIIGSLKIYSSKVSHISCKDTKNQCQNKA